MKIYVSDKEIDNNNLNYVEDDFVEEYWLLRGRKEEDGFEVYDDVGLVEIQSLEQHEQEIRKPLEDEIIELKEHIRALKSSHDLSHQAYLFAKNEGLDLQNQERQKVIAGLEEWLESAEIRTTEQETWDALQELKQKLKEMKGDK